MKVGGLVEVSVLEETAIIIEAMQFRANELELEHSLNGAMEPIDAAEVLQKVVDQIQEQLAE